jgi:hypothetical protein
MHGFASDLYSVCHGYDKTTPSWARFLTRRENHLERKISTPGLTECYNFDKDDLMRFVLDILRICNLTTTDLDMNAKAVSFLATHLSPDQDKESSHTSEEESKESTQVSTCEESTTMSTYDVSEDKRQESTSKYCYYLDLFLQGLSTPPETMLFELPLGRMTSLPLLRWPERKTLEEVPPVIPLYYELTTREELVIRHAMEAIRRATFVRRNKMIQNSTFNKYS